MGWSHLSDYFAFNVALSSVWKGDTFPTTLQASQSTYTFSTQTDLVTSDQCWYIFWLTSSTNLCSKCRHIFEHTRSWKDWLKHKDIFQTTWSTNFGWKCRDFNHLVHWYKIITTAQFSIPPHPETHKSAGKFSNPPDPVMSDQIAENFQPTWSSDVWPKCQEYYPARLIHKLLSKV